MWFNLKQEIPYYLFKRFVRFLKNVGLISIIVVVVVYYYSKWNMK